MTTTHIRYQPRFAVRPDARYLTPAIHKQLCKADDINRRRAQTVAERDALDGVANDEQAELADRQAQAQAVLAGRSAASVGIPAQTALADGRKALDVEIDALATAHVIVEDQIADAVQAIQADDKASGRAALAAASDGCLALLAEVSEAFDQLDVAQAVHSWLAAVAGVPSYGQTAWRGTSPRPISLADRFARFGIRPGDAVVTRSELLTALAVQITKEH